MSDTISWQFQRSDIEFGRLNQCWWFVFNKVEGFKIIDRPMDGWSASWGSILTKTPAGGRWALLSSSSVVGGIDTEYNRIWILFLSDDYQRRTEHDDDDYIDGWGVTPKVQECFDYLHDSLMCHADTNIKVFDNSTGKVSGWGGQRVCRDIMSLLGWANEHSWPGWSMEGFCIETFFIVIMLYIPFSSFAAEVGICLSIYTVFFPFLTQWAMMLLLLSLLFLLSSWMRLPTSHKSTFLSPAQSWSGSHATHSCR